MLSRDTYLEIDLDLLKHNVKSIISYKKQDIAFVLKANAYGMGAKVIASELNQYEEVKFLCVSTLNEALEIEDLTNKKIWILGYLSRAQILIANEHNFVISIYSFEHVKDLPNPNEVFVNIDTGFNRLGSKPTQEFVNEIISIHALNGIKVLGIFTHLGLQDVSSNEYQINQFDTIKYALDSSNVKFKYYSIMDSIGLTRIKSTSCNLPRVGAMLFGLLQPSERGKIDVEIIFSLKTKISRIYTLENDEFVGYSYYKVPKNTTIATIPIGYSDGLFRNMKNAYILHESIKLKYLGLLGMDQSIIDISDSDLDVGSILTVYGRNGISVKKLSNILSTNKNEIISKISIRIPRVYYENGNIKYLVDQNEVIR